MYAPEEIDRSAPIKVGHSHSLLTSTMSKEEFLNRDAARFTLRGWVIQLVTSSQFDALLGA